MFASDGVGIVGGVAAIGVGLKAPGNGAIFGVGNEPAVVPLANQNIQPRGNFRPKLNVAVTKYPFEIPGEKAPGLSGIFGNAFLHIASLMFGRPEPTRKNNVPTQFERAAFLTGLPAPTDLAWEAASANGLDFGESGTVDLQAAADGGPQPIINRAITPRDNISEQTQDYNTNEADQLFTFRHSFPNVAVHQTPVIAHSIVLQQIANAGAFVGEINIPTDATTARITWTNSQQNDLWVNFGGSSFIPVGTTQPGGATNSQPTQQSANNDGPMLNPDVTKEYFVKGKRGIGLACANQATVNIQFYKQA